MLDFISRKRSHLDSLHSRLQKVSYPSLIERSLQRSMRCEIETVFERLHEQVNTLRDNVLGMYKSEVNRLDGLKEVNKGREALEEIIDRIDMIENAPK